MTAIPRRSLPPLASCAVLLLGCGGDEPASRTPAPESASESPDAAGEAAAESLPEEPGAEVPDPVDPGVLAAAEPVLERYESMRAALFEDRVDPVPDQAAALTELAETTADETPRLAEPMRAIAGAAAELVETDPVDAEAIRLGFGRVSRAVLQLLADVPALREGRYVFRCPMAAGYQKWVQSTSRIANPYMGSRMPRCGHAGDWDVQ